MTQELLQVPASLVAQVVKNPPAMQETQVWSLGWEDPLEKGMATHSSILAWRIPWTEETGALQYMRLQRVRHNWATNTDLHFVSPHPHSAATFIFVSNFVLWLSFYLEFHLEPLPAPPPPPAWAVYFASYLPFF